MQIEEQNKKRRRRKRDITCPQTGFDNII